MDSDERIDDRLTAWWLAIALSRQEELLMATPPPMPWLDESLATAGVGHDDVRRFLTEKRHELEATRDAGINPRPD